MKRSDIQDTLLEAYVEFLREQEATLPSSIPNTPTPKKQPVPGDVKHALRKVINSLFGASHLDFVDKIQLVVPNPSQFQVFLKNGQSFYLKWMGKSPQDTEEESQGIEHLGQEKKGSFQAEIEGKKYFLGSLSEYEQALDKLGDILKNGLIKQGEEAGGEAFGEVPSELPPAGGESLPPEGEEAPETGFEEETPEAL